MVPRNTVVLGQKKKRGLSLEATSRLIVLAQARGIPVHTTVLHEWSVLWPRRVNTRHSGSQRAVVCSPMMIFSTRCLRLHRLLRGTLAKTNVPQNKKQKTPLMLTRSLMYQVKCIIYVKGRSPGLPSNTAHHLSPIMHHPSCFPRARTIRVRLAVEPPYRPLPCPPFPSANAENIRKHKCAPNLNLSLS